MSKKILTANDKKLLLDSIRSIEDFPKAGIIFKDITTLLNNKEAYALTMQHFEDRYKDYNLDYTYMYNLLVKFSSHIFSN